MAAAHAMLVASTSKSSLSWWVGRCTFRMAAALAPFDLPGCKSAATHGFAAFLLCEWILVRLWYVSHLVFASQQARTRAHTHTQRVLLKHCQAPTHKHLQTLVELEQKHVGGSSHLVNPRSFRMKIRGRCKVKGSPCSRVVTKTSLDDEETFCTRCLVLI